MTDLAQRLTKFASYHILLEKLAKLSSKDLELLNKGIQSPQSLTTAERSAFALLKDSAEGFNRVFPEPRRPTPEAVAVARQELANTSKKEYAKRQGLPGFVDGPAGKGLPMDQSRTVAQSAINRLEPTKTYSKAQQLEFGRTNVEPLGGDTSIDPARKRKALPRGGVVPEPAVAPRQPVVAHRARWPSRVDTRVLPSGQPAVAPSWGAAPRDTMGEPRRTPSPVPESAVAPRQPAVSSDTSLLKRGPRGPVRGPVVDAVEFERTKKHVPTPVAPEPAVAPKQPAVGPRAETPKNTTTVITEQERKQRRAWEKDRADRTKYKTNVNVHTKAKPIRGGGRWGNVLGGMAGLGILGGGIAYNEANKPNPWQQALMA
jgi:hypothetical protein